MTLETVRDRLVRLAYRFLWNREEAEDVAHDALAAAFEKADSLRDGDKWWSWVCRIVVQRCRERGRQAQRWKRHEEPYRTEVSRKAEEPVTGDPPDGAECVRELLGMLPRRQYEVMVLRHLQEMCYEEISRVLDISPTTARVHARAGRETLRNLMAARYPGWVGPVNEGGGERS